MKVLLTGLGLRAFRPTKAQLSREKPQNRRIVNANTLDGAND